MNTLSFKTVSVNKATAQKEWVLVDATDLVLGRMCSKVAKLLRGKYKPSFTPHVDCGDNVIIINADKIQLTGNKWTGRVYVRHTGYPGGIKERSLKACLTGKHPERALAKAVERMLPKNALGRKILKNLKVYCGGEHPHAAQNPKLLDVAAANSKNVKRG